jgi:hypothetical protein
LGPGFLHTKQYAWLLDEEGKGKEIDGGLEMGTVFLFFGDVKVGSLDSSSSRGLGSCFLREIFLHLWRHLLHNTSVSTASTEKILDKIWLKLLAGRRFDGVGLPPHRTHT